MSPRLVRSFPWTMRRSLVVWDASNGGAVELRPGRVRARVRPRGPRGRADPSSPRSRPLASPRDARAAGGSTRAGAASSPRARALSRSSMKLLGSRARTRRTRASWSPSTRAPRPTPPGRFPPRSPRADAPRLAETPRPLLDDDRRPSPFATLSAVLLRVAPWVGGGAQVTLGVNWWNPASPPSPRASPPPPRDPTGRAVRPASSSPPSSHDPTSASSSPKRLRVDPSPAVRIRTGARFGVGMTAIVGPRRPESRSRRRGAGQPRR